MLQNRLIKNICNSGTRGQRLSGYLDAIITTWASFSIEGYLKIAVHFDGIFFCNIGLYFRWLRMLILPYCLGLVLMESCWALRRAKHTQPANIISGGRHPKQMCSWWNSLLFYQEWVQQWHSCCWRWDTKGMSMVCLTQLPSDNKRSAVVLLYSMLPCSLWSTVLFQISDCLNASYFLFSLWGAPCDKHVLPL